LNRSNLSTGNNYSRANISGSRGKIHSGSRYAVPHVNYIQQATHNIPVITRRKALNDNAGNTESTPNLVRNKNVIEMMSAAQL
jgi:hypothetical protein